MRTENLNERIARLEADASLFEPDELRARIEALDLLDAYTAGAGPQEMRVEALRTRLEAANASVYEAIRQGIRKNIRKTSRGRMRRGAPDNAPQDNMLAAWIERCAGPARSEPVGSGYDWLDELISGVLDLREPDLHEPDLRDPDLREPESANIRLEPEMVFYQPTPGRHILRMMRLCALSAADVLVDLGSGLGHVPILAALLTPASCVGIELEAAYIATAHACAHNLGLRRAKFLQQDARAADLSQGTVFYLYTPFTGSILESVLRRLRQQSKQRAFRICTFGPCTQTVAREPWLRAHATPDAERITLFHPRG